jgi:hypothetical protein
LTVVECTSSIVGQDESQSRSDPRIERMPSGLRVTRRTRSLAILAMLAWATTACVSPPRIDQNAAVSIATAYPASGQASGISLEQVHAGTPQDVGGAWRVTIDAVIRDPQHPNSPAGPIHAMVDVDKTSGQAHMFAQG